jgi:hypothetical protein
MTRKRGACARTSSTSNAFSKKTASVLCRRTLPHGSSSRPGPDFLPPRIAVWKGARCIHISSRSLRSSRTTETRCTPKDADRRRVPSENRTVLDHLTWEYQAEKPPLGTLTRLESGPSGYSPPVSVSPPNNVDMGYKGLPLSYSPVFGYPVFPVTTPIADRLARLSTPSTRPACVANLLPNTSSTYRRSTHTQQHAPRPRHFL